MDDKTIDDKVLPPPPPPPLPGAEDGRPCGEPKRSGEVGELHISRPVAVRPQQRLLHDPAVTFEEYVFYAARSRAEEDEGAAAAAADAAAGGRRVVSLKTILIPSAAGAGPGAAAELNLSDPAVRAGVSDEEWTNASRALRTATAAACFYLITTDILGPFVSDCFFFFLFFFFPLEPPRRAVGGGGVVVTQTCMLTFGPRTN